MCGLGTTDDGNHHTTATFLDETLSILGYMYEHAQYL